MIEESTNLPTLRRVNKFSFKSNIGLPKAFKKCFHGFKQFSLVALAIFSFILFPSIIQAQPDGKKLFQQCATCHKANDKKLIGPGLKGTTERLDMEWLIPWVRNSAEVVKSGDAYANQIFKEYNGVAMTAFPSLTDEEIIAIFAYVDETNAAPAAGNADGAGTIAAAPVEPVNNSWIYILALVVAGILLYILTRVKSGIEYAIREKEGVSHPAHQSVGESIGTWISDNNKLVILAVIVLLVMGSVDGWNRLAGIGVYQGYQPEQPIKFSHKLHAGINKIDCQYCHSGAEKSRHANIPSANVCMNCHSAISEGPIYGETEIAKIYDALDYNPETQVYGDNTKPIKWVRVHTLPDLAYFNHSQHVAVGEIECQTCHGKIEEMDVVEQHAELTMAWCIDCHRTTEVKMEGNAYYDDYHAYLVEKHGSDAQITVDKIGGMECAKCHY